MALARGFFFQKNNGKGHKPQLGGNCGSSKVTGALAATIMLQNTLGVEGEDAASLKPWKPCCSSGGGSTP